MIRALYPGPGPENRYTMSNIEATQSGAPH